MTFDYLDGTPYKIKQNKKMYHFNSDTELLGKYIDLNNEDLVLDVGTNNGALLCYAALFNPKLLVGIDIFDDVIDLAKYNLEMNDIKANLYVSSVQSFMHDPFTAIICNPPYFNSLSEGENKYLLAARHENYFNLDEFFDACNRLLKDEGVIHLVYPYHKINVLIDVASKHNFYPFQVRISYDKKDGNKKSVLLTFKRNENNMVYYLPAAYLNDRKSFKL